MNWRTPFSGNVLVLLIVSFCFVLIGLDRLLPQSQPLPFVRSITLTLYDWVILLSAFGLLAGGFNVVWIHFKRIQSGQPDWVLSLLLLVVLTSVITLGLLDRAGTAAPLMEWIFDNVISPIQASLFALLAFFLVSAAYRYLRLGRTGGAWMLLGVLLMLVIQMPLTQQLLTEPINAAFHWLLEWPIMAVMRGVILGSSLALITAALRFVAREQ